MTLAPGNTYLVASLENAGGDQYRDLTAVTPAAGLAWGTVNAMYSLTPAAGGGGGGTGDTW